MLHLPLTSKHRPLRRVRVREVVVRGREEPRAEHLGARVAARGARGRAATHAPAVRRALFNPVGGLPLPRTGARRGLNHHRRHIATVHSRCHGSESVR